MTRIWFFILLMCHHLLYPSMCFMKGNVTCMCEWRCSTLYICKAGVDPWKHGGSCLRYFVIAGECAHALSINWTNAYNAQVIGMLQLYTSVVRTLYKPPSLKRLIAILTVCLLCYQVFRKMTKSPREYLLCSKIASENHLRRPFFGGAYPQTP